MERAVNVDILNSRENYTKKMSRVSMVKIIKLHIDNLLVVLIGLYIMLAMLVITIQQTPRHVSISFIAIGM